MKPIFRSTLLAAILLAANVLHAQLNNVDLSAIESQNPIPASQLPLVGTFYSAANPQLPPAPADLLGLSAWVLDSNTGIFLLDDFNVSSGGGFHAMDDSEPPDPGSGGGTNGGDYDFTNSPTYSFPTNGLWLQITNVADSNIYVNINGATDYVYAVLSCTNLSPSMAVSNWNIETEVFPGGNTNTMPFNVPMNGRNPLFLWAMDWTGVTANGNQTPLWWFFYYFGAAGLDLLDSDLDSQGNTLLSDYEYGQDPNIINFLISATNNYANNMSVPLQLNITAGTPNYFAVLVDSTDFADAAWNSYTSSEITINLGLCQGWHTVCVGLRGLPPDAQPTWETIMLNLDTSPPLLVITNPVNTTVAAPYIELQGYANEKLSSVTYAISNAFGIETNLVGYLTGEAQSADGNGPITNYFQCFDVALTNGPNLVTVTATDPAGNQTVTNLNFTLDYSSNTNPPMVAITWPQNGTQIGGTNFTLDGQVDDPTETVCASITDTNGDTNTVNGLVERNGKFWVERIPLNAGTNNLTLTVTNAAGNVTVTNICVVQSAIMLTMDPVTPSSQLWQPTVNLTGEISDSTYAVWVNGVKGTNNGNGTWSANNVPTTSGGTASFTMTGYAPTEQQPDGSYGN